jgi:TolA-binding protein
MTVVGLHPEELFDKLLEGEITTPERERLRAHLEGCAVCRFEYAARLDFQEEALRVGAMSRPEVLPLRVPQTAPAAAAAARPPARRRSRLLVWGLSAALLITASGALASVLAGKAPWQAMSQVFAPAKTSAVLAPPSKSQLSASVAERCSGADCSGAAPSAKAGTPVASVAALAADQATVARESASPGARRPSGAVVGAKLRSTRAAPVEAETSASEPAKEPASAAKLFADANQARRSGEIGRASGLYQLLQEQYPSSSEAELSRVTLALLLLDSGDAQGALKGFERYLAGGSRGLEAEALVGRARALGRLGRRDLETSAWREVQRKFPRSIYGRQATERLATLGQL